MRIALTIAGSDPSGGAGIQADLKTFLHFNIHGLSAITAIAVQNSSGVKEVFDLQADILEGQLEILFSDFRINAVKSGMLYSKENILIIERALKRHKIDNYILDPIIISSSGFPLLKADAISVMKERLFPLATLVTPNLKEAEALLDLKISNEEELQAAAKSIYSFGPKGVLIKGFKSGKRMVDILYMDNRTRRFESIWIPKKNIHGAGCILSAAITASVALGKDPNDAVRIARSFVLNKIKGPTVFGNGTGLYYLT